MHEITWEMLRKIDCVLAKNDDEDEGWIQRRMDYVWTEQETAAWNSFESCLGHGWFFLTITHRKGFRKLHQHSNFDLLESEQYAMYTWNWYVNTESLYSKWTLYLLRSNFEATRSNHWNFLKPILSWVPGMRWLVIWQW